jgi:glutathione peroxidase
MSRDSGKRSRSSALRLGVLAAGTALLGFAVQAANSPDVLTLTMKRLDGSEQDLAAYKGRVVMLVNTASKCGFTPQYEGLEALYRKYQARGFVVLGFPSNDFKQQEPGSDAQIAEFCRATYSIEFPMFSKLSVKGDAMHPLYRMLTSLPAPLGGPVEWNFQKYLVDRSGHVVAKFRPATTPDDPALVAQLEALLAQARGAR